MADSSVGTVRAVSRRDEALADVDHVARQWAETMRSAARLDTRLGQALLAAHNLGVPDPQLVDIINRHVSRGERIYLRLMRAGVMSVRRRMGLAPPK